MSHQETFAINQARWDEVVAIHVASPFYRVKEFLAGEDILLPIEAAEVGDLRGKSLIHLQCHFGLDTLALTRRGAQVTGLDFSKNAIAAARDLAAQAGIAANFVEGNLYDAPALITERFDGATFVQRRFADTQEMNAVLNQMRRANVPTQGREDRGYLHAELFVSRPAAEVAKAPINRLISVSSGANRIFAGLAPQVMVPAHNPEGFSVPLAC